MPRKSKKPVRKQTHSPTGKVVGPQLQLDIVGGTYDEDRAMTIIWGSTPAGDVIELIALFTPNDNPTQAEIDAMLEGRFYLSSTLSDGCEARSTRSS